MKNSKKTDKYEKVLKKSVDLNSLEILGISAVENGKTSILNMVIEEIDAISKNNMEDEKPIIIRFDPWNYSDCSQLISQFFAVMQSKFKTEKGNKALEEIGEVLADYSKLLDIIDTVIPMKN